MKVVSLLCSTVTLTGGILNKPHAEAETCPLGWHPILDERHILGTLKYLFDLPLAAEFGKPRIHGQGMISSAREELAVQLPSIDEL